MTYNPRIKNKRNEILQVSASVLTLTGTLISDSAISASNFYGTGGGGSGEISGLFNNTFTGINTFNNYYVTASVGVTGSDAKFTLLTASYITANADIAGNNASFTIISSSIVSASQYIGLTGGGDVLSTNDNTFSGINTFNNHYITASVGITTNNINTSVITASVVSASQYIGLNGGGDVLANFSNTFTDNNIFNNYYITASVGVTGSDGKFTSISGTLNNLTTNTSIISSDSNLNSNQHVILASASLIDITLTLPLVSDSKFRQYIIKKIDSNTAKIIISGTSGQTIDGLSGVQISTQYESLMFVNDGVDNWYII